MATEKPAILIIGGAWHKPRHYSKLKKALESAGLEVHCPELPSTDEARPPTGGLMRDIKYVREAAEQLIETGHGRRVVALAHSYGGQVMTHALHGLGIEVRKANGKAGGFVCLIYMCAYAMCEGGSVFDKVEEMDHLEMMDVVFKYNDDRTMACRDPKRHLIGDGGNATPGEIDEYLESLALWNGWGLEDCIGKCAWRELPVTYIKTLSGMAVPSGYQDTMIKMLDEEKGDKIPVYEVQSGHCPNLTAVDEIAEIVHAVVAAT